VEKLKKEFANAQIKQLYLEKNASHVLEVQ